MKKLYFVVGAIILLALAGASFVQAGMPAARLNDQHTCPAIDPPNPPGFPHIGGPIIMPCSPNVFIQGHPAARQGDFAMCTGVGYPAFIVMGSPTVFINSHPAARLTDPTSHGGFISTSCTSVFIGP